MSEDPSSVVSTSDSTLCTILSGSSNITILLGQSPEPSEQAVLRRVCAALCSNSDCSVSKVIDLTDPSESFTSLINDESISEDCDSLLLVGVGTLLQRGPQEKADEFADCLNSTHSLNPRRVCVMDGRLCRQLWESGKPEGEESVTVALKADGCLFGSEGDTHPLSSLLWSDRLFLAHLKPEFSDLMKVSDSLELAPVRAASKRGRKSPEMGRGLDEITFDEHEILKLTDMDFVGCGNTVIVTNDLMELTKRWVEAGLCLHDALAMYLSCVGKVSEVEDEDCTIQVEWRNGRSNWIPAKACWVVWKPGLELTNPLYKLDPDWDEGDEQLDREVLGH